MLSRRPERYRSSRAELLWLWPRQRWIIAEAVDNKPLPCLNEAECVLVKIFGTSAAKRNVVLTPFRRLGRRNVDAGRIQQPLEILIQRLGTEHLTHDRVPVCKLCDFVIALALATCAHPRGVIGREREKAIGHQAGGSLHRA